MNSLKLKPIYVDDQLLNAIQSFKNGALPEDILVGLTESVREKLSKALPAIIDAKILVHANVSDHDILEFFRNNYLGKPYISIAYFILTDACNLGCKYCFVENRMPDKHTFKAMSIQNAERGLDFFCRQIQHKPELFEKEKTIVIYGGEPLMNGNVLQFLLEDIERRKQNATLPEKTEISLVTNATLVTVRLAKLLAKHRVNVAVSIDGNAVATNTARQYKDSRPVYSDVKAGYELLKHHGVNVGISCTLNEQSLTDFDATMQTLLDDLQVQSLGFNMVLPSEDYPISHDYDHRASQSIIKAFLEFRKRGIFEDRIMRKVDAFVKHEIHAFDCGASGGGQIVIAPDGHIGICHGYLGSRKHFTTTVNDLVFNPSNNPVYK